MHRVRPLLPMREYFNEPELLGPVWTLTKGLRTAACQVWSHQFGLELRLLVTGDDLPRTQVVCSQEDLIRVQEDWRGARSERLDLTVYSSPRLRITREKQE
jgi:hypothetical protein